MPDIVLGWFVILAPAILSGIFILIPAADRKPRAHRRWRIGLLAAGLLFAPLSFYQQYRMAHSGNNVALQVVHELGISNPAFRPKPPLMMSTTTVDTPLKVGSPYGIHMVFQNTTGGVLKITDRREMFPLMPRETLDQYSLHDRSAIEKNFFDKLIQEARPTEQSIPATNDGVEWTDFNSPPLKAADVKLIRSGQAVYYFLDEIRDASTNQVLIEFCGFVGADQKIYLCLASNK